jgi:hypothetical protein
MGHYDETRRVIPSWQRTIGAMKDHGALLILAGCRHGAPANLDQLIADHGEDWSPRDCRPTCPKCGALQHYMASPAEGTPMRPLLTPSGVLAKQAFDRKAFLKSFRFTRLDLIRIKALAEATTENYSPSPLDDLDVPFRVGACMPGGEKFSSGELLGSWAGRRLLYWAMNEGERTAWDRRRRRPRGI